METKTETCTTCDGQKKVLISYGTQYFEQSEVKCPTCNGVGSFQIVNDGEQEFVLITRSKFSHMQKEDQIYCSRLSNQSNSK